MILLSDANASLQANFDNFKNIFEEEYTWIAGFMRNVYRYGDRTAMISPLTDQSWTYKQFNNTVNKLSNSFLADKIKKGSVIMYQLLNCPEFAFLYVAAHKICAVNCPINYRLSAGEIAMNIDDSMPEMFIFEAQRSETIKQALSIAKHNPKRLIAVGADSDSDWYVSFDKYIAENADTEPVIEYKHNIYDETTRMYTSGTTGRQKGVPITSINEVLSSHDVAIHFPLNLHDITMNTTPWFHRGGLHCAGPAPTFYVGATMVILPKFEPEICLKYIEKYKITFVIGVPTVLERLTIEQEKQLRDLSSLRGIVTMGSPLERAACIRYQKVLTPNIFNGYGTTETFWNTFLRPFDLPEMAGTAGGSCLDDEVRVVKSYPNRRAEPDDEAATDGIEVGEVIIKTSAKSSYCYFNNDEETKNKFYRGYAYTGDLGTWDKNKYISIRGRKDDMIISSGENIYPTQVEEVLNSFDKVSDCIVTSVPDKARGELVTAYIVKADDSLTYDELDRFCKDSPLLANYKRPRYYKFIAEIPLNQTGKKLHNKAKKMALDDLMNGLLYRC